MEDEIPQDQKDDTKNQPNDGVHSIPKSGSVDNKKKTIGNQQSKDMQEKKSYKKLLCEFINPPHNQWKRIEVLTLFYFIATVAIFLLSIRMFRQTKRQFAAENNPTLAILSIHVMLDPKPQYVGICFKIMNIGKQPARIYEIRQGFCIDSNKQSYLPEVPGIPYPRIAVSDPRKVNVFVTKEAPYSHCFTGDPIEWEKDSFWIKQGKDLFYIEARYHNFITNENRSFIVIMRLYPKFDDPQPVAETVYNENLDSIGVDKYEVDSGPQ